MLSKDLENTLNSLFKECSDNKDEFVTIEHLLLVLTKEDSSRRVFDHLSIDIESLQKEIKEYIKKNVPKSVDKKEIQPTLAFQRVLQRAIFHVQSSGKTEVNGENLLAALFSEKESYAVYMLSRRNISRLDVVEYISHGKNTAVETEESLEETPKQKESHPEFLTNLNNESDSLLLKNNSSTYNEQNNKKIYKSIREYKPSGNLIYNEDLLDKTITKINN